MPKRFDPEIKARAVRMVREHLSSYGSVTRTAAAVGPQLGISENTLRRWVLQADIDDGVRDGVPTEVQEEIKRLTAEVKRLREDERDLAPGLDFLRGGARPPRPLICAFIDTLISDGFAVETACAVLSAEGCRVAARTYRSWKQAGQRPCARTRDDAIVIDALLATCGTPEGLYGRRKMTAHLRRVGAATGVLTLERVSHHTVDRLMRDLGLAGVRRGKKLRTTIADPAAPARRPDLLKRDFTAAAPNQRWVADFTYCRTWSGFVFVAFIVDVYAQRIIGWHAATTRTTELVLTCLRMATWQRDHDGHPVTRGQLTQHHDAGSQHTSLLYTEHLAMKGIADSVGSVGDAYDNCLMESIIGLYKTECLRPGPS